MVRCVYGFGMSPGPKLKAIGPPKAAGEIALGDITHTLPFGDPIVVIEMDRETLWSAFEGALEA